jgi:hypothetical protein
MQSDGNFVIYYENSNPKRASNTGGNADALLTVQDDGNVVIYRHGRKGNPAGAVLATQKSVHYL